MSRTADLFREQPAAEQRKLLRLLVSEASSKGGELRMSLNEPFERLRLSNAASRRNHKGFDTKTPDLDIWRATVDAFRTFLAEKGSAKDCLELGQPIHHKKVRSNESSVSLAHTQAGYVSNSS